MSQFKEEGFLAIVAVVLILVLGFLGVTASFLVTASTRAGTQNLSSTQSFYLAASGLEQATHLLFTPSLTTRDACLAMSLSNTLGAGAYAVTGSGPTYVSPATTLSGAQTATDTTITVVSSAGYVTTGGRINIDREAMNYSAVSGNSFIGVTRGMDGTTAVAHAAGARVSQYQCDLAGSGGVPNLNAAASQVGPYAKRFVSDAVQLQEAWAVGNRVSGALNIARWNRPTEVSWSAFALAGTYNLSGISTLGYGDGWAVGDSGNFLRWNGSTWTLTTVSPNVNYAGVYCSASNDCHAVGQKSGAPVLLHWNGTAWSRITAIGSVGTNNLNAVNCDAANDCWAVGDSSGGMDFYQWNGTSWTGVLTTVSASPYNGVFCVSSTDCWAVGNNQTFARKSGATWANFATGLPNVHYNSVFCNSSSDCWAVGAVNSTRDMFAHWNGTAWSRDASNPTPIANLNGVTCANTNDCWAVGQTNSGNHPTFVHWDGTSWTQVTAPAGLPDAQLNAITIVSPGSQPQAAWREVYP